jgi:hypothetical protein
LEGAPLEAARQPANNKPLPTAPAASASSQPAAQQALPALTFTLYLPVTQRYVTRQHFVGAQALTFTLYLPVMQR